MHLIENPAKFDEKNLSSRFDVLADSANGKWYFTESEIFIASEKSRILINSLPDICNILQHFSFETSRAILSAGGDEMGESIFSEKAIEESVSQDVAIMTQGKTRELYYRVREQLSMRYDETCEKASGLRYLQNSLAAATSAHINEVDCLLEEMADSGLFAHGNWSDLIKVESMLILHIAEYIGQNAVSADYERYLDAMRINLSF